VKTGTMEFQSPLSGIYIRDILKKKSQDMQSEIASSIRNILQASNAESKYVTSLVDKYKIAVPELDFNNIKKTDNERETRGTELRGQVVIEDRMYRVWVVTFHIPYTGDVQLLQFVPRSGAQSWYPYAFIREQNLCFEISSSDRNIEMIKSQKEHNLAFLKERAEAVKTELDEYNITVERSIKHTFDTYKQKYLEDKRRLDEL